MHDQFITIWNQLVLLTQFPIYTCTGVQECFDNLEKQVRNAYAQGNKELSTLQMLTLMNAINTWRDIIAEQSAEASGAESEEGDLEKSVAAQ